MQNTENEYLQHKSPKEEVFHFILKSEGLIFFIKKECAQGLSWIADERGHVICVKGGGWRGLQCRYQTTTYIPHREVFLYQVKIGKTELSLVVSSYL